MRLPLLGLLCAIVAGPAVAQVDRVALVRLSASVLKVEVQRQQGGYALGSGVVVQDERLVTNCHVTHDAVQIHVLRGDTRWRVDAQASDADHDLCVLRVPGLVGRSVAFGRAGELEAGQSVTAVGFTGGLGIQSSAGNVVGLHGLDGGSVIQSDNWFTSGASGGGLFDDKMQLVGVLTFRLRGGAAHYFSAPVDWVLPMLQPGADYRPVAPADPSALAYWQRPGAGQPEFLRAIAGAAPVGTAAATAP